MEKVTIKDVAKEAGVSIGTVSNALNGGRYINADTKKRVMDAVEKLQYVPNLNGRYLKTGATKMLGFFTNSVSGPYFCTLMDHLSRECGRQGYNLTVFVTRDTPVIMENLMGKQLDGAVIFEDTAIGQPEIDRLQKAGIPLVFLDREVKGKNISSVLFDSLKEGYEAARYLINLGHKKIVFLESVDDVLDSLRRKEGFLAAMKEFGLEVPQDAVLQGFFDEECSYNATKMYYRMHSGNMPDAFLAGNDASAIGCIKALQSEGFRVPQDISVVGFDDIDISQYFHPPLTTVRNPIARQAVEAVDLLIKMIQGDEAGAIQKLEGAMVVRESCTVKKR